MDFAILSVIILFVTLVIYLIPKVPIWITTIMAMIAMAITGIVPWSTVYGGFSNNIMFLMAGMAVVGRACIENGMAQKIGKVVIRIGGGSERRMMVAVLCISSFLSVFLVGSLTIAIMLPIIDSVLVQSFGKVRRKMVYMSLGLGSVLGNNLTGFSASSMVAASAILVEAGFRSIGAFEPTLIAAPSLVIFIIFWGIWGYRLQDKWYDFDDVPLADSVMEAEEKIYDNKKMLICGATLIFVIIGLVCYSDFGAFPLIGMCIVVLTGCIDTKTAISSIPWTTIIVAGGSIGFSKALDASGGGLLMANTILDWSGPLGQSPFGMAVILFIVGSLLSDIMNDSATAAILMPIVLAISSALGTDPTPLVLATCFGIKLGLATPISVVCMTQVQPAGYRFKDYLKAGGLQNVISGVCCMIGIYLVYFL